MTAQQSTLDTIVAQATAPGEGAIAIVRLSGPEAVAIVQQMCSQKRLSHRAYRGLLRNSEGKILDDAMILEMHAPRSYTGEDVVELHTHGSRAVVESVTASAKQLGARLAGPGEFTMRAFLNGKMDLAQAEAVTDLIAASNDEQRTVAARHLKGELSAAIGELVDEMEHVLADWQAALDFPEYPTGDGLMEEHTNRLSACKKRMEQLIAQASVRLHKPTQVVLCGAPNVGKSTLLNAWAQEDRVIVDAQPGTTRDPVEVSLNDGLLQWSVWDTAGIRDGADRLEAQGAQMALQRARDADVCIWLLDPEQPVWPPSELDCHLVASKMDLCDSRQKLALQAEADQRGLSIHSWLSPKTGQGVMELRDEIIRKPTSRNNGVVVTRQRHKEKLEIASENLSRVLDGLSQGVTLDMLAIDLQEATHALGEILGRNVDADVLDVIFSEFCIGK